MQDDFKHIWPLLDAEVKELERLQQVRNTIKPKMEAVSKKSIKDDGLDALEETDREQVDEFVQAMSKYGLFFVSCGELECWLKDVGVKKSNDKAAWLTNMFVALGSDPEASGYVEPAVDDVWGFIDAIEAWIDKPDRLGIPD